jgi:biotin synthase
MQWIRDAGMRIGTGNIIGLPSQTRESLLSDIRLVAIMRPDFVSTTPFIPDVGTPLQGFPSGDIDLTLNTMAIWRISLKGPLIPAVSALEKVRPGGQLMGLNAGANILTITLTPESFLDKNIEFTQKQFHQNLQQAIKTADSAGLRVRSPFGKNKP